jgi:DNA invertase Pin-like site-specific DNA recombinase
MWSDCRAHKIDICVITALDRLARSLKQLIEALDEFGRLGIDFVCLKQDIDSTNNASRLLFHIIGAVAEFERSLIAERVRLGLQNARKKGRRLGRPPIRVLSAAEMEKVKADIEGGLISSRGRNKVESWQWLPLTSGHSLFC